VTAFEGTVDLTELIGARAALDVLRWADTRPDGAAEVRRVVSALLLSAARGEDARRLVLAVARETDPDAFRDEGNMLRSVAGARARPRG